MNKYPKFVSKFIQLFTFYGMAGVVFENIASYKNIELEFVFFAPKTGYKTKIVHYNQLIYNALLFDRAESGGFEPPIPLPVRQFSKLVVSATHPTLLTDLLRVQS